MEEMNWTRIIGLTLLIVGGTCGFIGGLALLASLLSPKYGFVILIALMLLIGACLFVYGFKKGGEHESE